MTLNDFYGITGEYENYLFDEKNRTESMAVNASDKALRMLYAGRSEAYAFLYGAFCALFPHIDVADNVLMAEMPEADKTAWIDRIGLFTKIMVDEWHTAENAARAETTDENLRLVNVGQYRAYTAARFMFYAFFQYVDFLRDIALGDGTNENTAPAGTAD